MRLVDTQRIHVRHLGVPAPLLFALGGGSMYLGAALAVVLFDRLSPAGVAVEFCGPVAVAAWGSRSRRDQVRFALLLALLPG